MALAIVGKGQRRSAQITIFDQADLKQADIILLLATEMGQRLLDFREQRRWLPIGSEDLKQAPFTKQLALFVTSLQNTIGEQENPIPQRQRIDLILVVECAWLQHP